MSTSSPKRILFQIGYEEKGLNARAELFRRFGHEVTSVADNEAAKQALASIPNVDVFIVGDTAPERTRKEMVDWLKANFPKRRSLRSFLPLVGGCDVRITTSFQVTGTSGCHFSPPRTEVAPRQTEVPVSAGSRPQHAAHSLLRKIQWQRFT